MDLGVNNINITQQQTLGPGGVAKTIERVSFYIGTNGPFALTYDPASDATTAKIRADIQDQVDKLTALHQWAGQ